MITIDVIGTPAPQGSKRHVGKGVMVESSKKVKPWRQDIIATVDRRRHTDDGVRVPGDYDQPLTEPIHVDIMFWLRRPQGHYGTGRNAGVLKATAPTYVDKKPDLDKLLRSTLDGLKEAGVYRDDAQVVRVTAVKLYANASTGARITITPADPPAPVQIDLTQQMLDHIHGRKTP